MGDFRNKLRKLEREAAIADRENRLRKGWTVFHHDFRPEQTYRNLRLDEAARHIQRLTGTPIAFWRCPSRGLSVEYRPLPPACGGKAKAYRMPRFSRLANEEDAKRELAEDMVMNGIALYRGLPNAVFDAEVNLLVSLLRAPPSVGAADWLALKVQLQEKSKIALETHENELRAHLLGQQYTGLQTGPVAIGVTLRARRV